MSAWGSTPFVETHKSRSAMLVQLIKCEPRESAELLLQLKCKHVSTGRRVRGRE